MERIKKEKFSWILICQHIISSIGWPFFSFTILWPTNGILMILQESLPLSISPIKRDIRLGLWWNGIEKSSWWKRKNVTAPMSAHKKRELSGWHGPSYRLSSSCSTGGSSFLFSFWCHAPARLSMPCPLLLFLAVDAHALMDIQSTAEEKNVKRHGMGMKGMEMMDLMPWPTFGFIK